MEFLLSVPHIPPYITQETAEKILFVGRAIKLLQQRKSNSPSSQTRPIRNNLLNGDSNTAGTNDAQSDINSNTNNNNNDDNQRDGQGEISTVSGENANTEDSTLTKLSSKNNTIMQSYLSNITL